MESLGSLLKHQRELRQWSLEDVARLTKLKVTYLSAMEGGKYDLLPSPFYARGYLTAYAKCLGLDPKEVLSQFDKVVKPLLAPKPLKIEKPIPPPPAKRPRPSLLYLLPVVLIVAVTIYLGRSPEQTPVRTERVRVTPAPLPSVSPLPETREVLNAKAGVSGAQPLPLDDAERDISLKGYTETRAPSSASLFEVLEASLGGEVGREGERLVLKERKSTFGGKHERAYFYTRIKAQKKGRIAHTWIHKGKKYKTIEMDVVPPAWSVYSYITLNPEHEGEWATEVRDGDTVLTTLSFKVSGSESGSIH
jgi:transcriptional regulator with XRE-family HTH domain